ncbi:MAG TPA: YihY/virulence factor BrkB family protein [Acidimicrobiales bacterium]|nr:YihY/virulence factor BrkB family protein [Acidimicrobiales bacterium]
MTDPPVAGRPADARSADGTLRRAWSDARRAAADQADDRLGLAAAGAAFWLLIAVFPATLAAVSIFGLVFSPEEVARRLASVANTGPDTLGAVVAHQLRHAAATSPAGLSVGLVLSVALALWSTSAGVYNLVRAIRVAYRLPSVPYVVARLHAAVGAIGVVLGLGVVAGVSALITDLLDRTRKGIEVLVGVPVLLVLLTLLTVAAYRFAARGPVGLRRLFPGAVLTAVAVVVLVVGFDVYVHVSTRFTAVYGALAGVVLAMLFAYLSIYAMLLGALINVEWGEAR